VKGKGKGSIDDIHPGENADTFRCRTSNFAALNTIPIIINWKIIDIPWLQGF
jgi:hypothetical protein